MLTQFVGKSGGNRPSVSLYYDYENEDIQGKNLAPDQVTPSPGASIRPDGNRLSEYKNFNLGVGGPVIKDRIWGHFCLPEPADLGGGAAGRQLPGRHALQHQAVQLHRQGSPTRSTRRTS